MEMTRSAGVARAMMAPRFLDVLFDTAWYERRLFFEAAIAADDLLAVHGETMQMFLGARFILSDRAGGTMQTLSVFAPSDAPGCGNYRVQRCVGTCAVDGRWNSRHRARGGYSATKV